MRDRGFHPDAIDSERRANSQDVLSPPKSAGPEAPRWADGAPCASPIVLPNSFQHPLDFTPPARVLPVEVELSDSSLTSPSQPRENSGSLGGSRRRAKETPLLNTDEGAEDMQPVLRRCVVCNAANSQGEQRKSGWKCRGCIGTKHKFGRDEDYRMMPSYIPDGCSVPTPDEEERRFRKWVSSELRRRRHKRHPLNCPPSEAYHVHIPAAPVVSKKGKVETQSILEPMHVAAFMFLAVLLMALLSQSAMLRLAPAALAVP
eukprot:Hpha_TRINITY_DN15290_c1_g1::TRINITY_DN15290_c1_g1_i1::g.64677::m.64677